MTCDRTFSVLVPVYNEQNTIYQVLEKIVSTPVIEGWKREMLVINDGSTDNSQHEIERFASNCKEAPLNVVNLKDNRGKGFVIQKAIELVHTDYLIIHDADLEYNCEDHNKLLTAVKKSGDIIYGSRFHNSTVKQAMTFWQYRGNRFLTTLFNLLNGLNLADMETCMKLLPVVVLKELNLKEKGFSIEPELTIKLNQISPNCIREIPVDYKPRRNKQGKKIRPSDGLRAIWVILRYSI